MRISACLCICILSTVLCYAQRDSVRADTTVTKEIVVEETFSPTKILRLNDVQLGAIYAAKKTELIVLDSIIANTATNNPRQTFSSIAGLNIWESDGSGLQLGIGGRGLSPNRTSNFTTRQNGYDISADPLGYPESYYSPPLEAIDRVEVIRGAASLRYGTQFGGLVNFRFRKGSSSSPFAGNVRLTGGSYGFAAMYAQVGGTIGSLNYTALYQGKRADGWRPNSDYDVHTGYAAVSYAIDDAFILRADYTHMQYLAHQPGGLTDRQFAIDAQQSVRERNWFSVNWNLASATADWLIDTATIFHTVFFTNLSSRTALGNLERINVADLGGMRTMITGEFRNFGNESTLQRDFTTNNGTSSLLVGLRLFSGTTTQGQGDASNGSTADFRYNNPNNLENSQFTFPNSNAAVFSEVVLRLAKGLSIVPGVRLEHITTKADGYYKMRVKDFAGNIIVDTNIYEPRTRSRTIFLAGIGSAYQVTEQLELYANASQNYRSITFSDMRISNPNVRVDTNLQDEKGYTLDVGVRGALTSYLSLDASLFYLRYSQRIGEIVLTDAAPLFLPYRYRTNIADAYTAGIEAVADATISALWDDNLLLPVVHFVVNTTVLQGRYINTSNSSIRNKNVELVPSYIVRSALNISWQNIKASYLMSFVGDQYTDATNARTSASAVTGLVPAYTVADLTLGYSWNSLSLDLSCNNLFDARYFTRRAESYPGPGIIPSDARSFFATLAVKF